MAAKRSHSLATEAAFLAYSETDVEYDLMRIVNLVAHSHASRWAAVLATAPAAEAVRAWPATAASDHRAG